MTLRVRARPLTSYKSFGEWIDSLGHKFISNHLGVDKSTVSCWRRGISAPRPELMKRIVVWSQGRMSYEMIVEFCISQKKFRASK